MSLSIGTLTLALRACTVPQRAAAIERRLLDAARSALAARLQPPPRHDAGGVAAVFIDEIVVEGAVNTAWDDVRIVDTLAQAITQAVSRSVARGEGRRFASRAEWLAAFLLALVDGRAWQGWWFEEMRGLRHLPVSAALRTVLSSPSQPGVSALALLPGAERGRVLQALDDADAARVLAAWAGEGGAPARPHVPAGRLWALAARPASRSAAGLLGACVELEREHGEGSALAGVLLLAALADLAATGIALPADADAASSERLRRWCRRAGVDEDWIGRLDAAQADALAAAAAAQAPGAAAVPSIVAWHTRHGGAFVLLAVMGWMGLPARWEQQLAADDRSAGDAAALSRLAALAVCALALAPCDPRAVLDDPGLRGALGLADADGLWRRHGARLVARLRHAPAAAGAAPVPLVGRRADRHLAGLADAVLARLAERVPGAAGASPAWLRVNLLAGWAAGDAEAGAGPGRALLGRPPLHVLLTLAGLARTTLALPGLRIDVALEDAA